MNADGSDQHRVTRTQTYSEETSSWSPDGVRIAFQVAETRNVDRGNAIAVMGRAGGVKLVTTGFARDGSYLDDREPEWSPDGSRIAFSRGDPRSGTYRIFTIAPNGNALTQITGGRFDRSPTWSPDGTRIAFRRGAKLWVVNLDGSGAAPVADGYFDDLDWSPDGSTFAFVRANRRTGARDLFTMPAAGGRSRQLTRTPLKSENAPAWSPDGTKIAYQLGTYRGGDIYVINADGTGATQLTTNAKHDAFPSWTR